MRERIIPELDSETFIAWESRQSERFELQSGFVLAFAGGTFAHDRIAFNIRIALEAIFEPPCRTFGSDVKVRVAGDVVYYPDATVVCGPISDCDSIVSAPLVVVEVLSPSTRSFDRSEKRSAYRSLANLTAYVIAHSDRAKIEIDRRDAQDVWRTEVCDGGSFAIGGGEISLAHTYARTEIEVP